MTNKKMTNIGRYYTIQVMSYNGKPYGLRLYNNIKRRQEKEIDLSRWQELYQYSLSLAQMRWLETFIEKER